MFTDFFKRYFVRALIAASVYCIMVVIFLVQKQFQSIWLLFLGNALYLAAIATIVYLSNKADKFEDSAITSTISGHILSVSGAALSVILSLLLYLLFYLGIDGTKGEALHQAPADLSGNGATHGMLFVLVVVAALGNTITGFFAALFTSFGASQRGKHKPEKT